MIEIDGVTVTLGHHPCWEIVDELCDTYDATLELITRPGCYTDEMDESIQRKLDRLNKEDKLIRRCLSTADQDNLGRLFTNEPVPSILLAYDSVLSQIDEMRVSRQQR